jgi:hypothetical protein
MSKTGRAPIVTYARKLHVSEAGMAEQQTISGIFRSCHFISLRCLKALISPSQAGIVLSMKA